MPGGNARVSFEGACEGGMNYSFYRLLKMAEFKHLVRIANTDLDVRKR